MVTGAARGIGRGIADTLASEGVEVVLAGLLELVSETARQIRTPYPSSEAYGEVLDVSQESAVKTLVENAMAKFGRLDIMANNAGFVKSEVRSEEDFQRLVHELQRSCDLGADSGILGATENAMSVEKTIRLFEQVDRANPRLYFDLENYHANTGFYTPDLIKPLMPYICQVHAKDGRDTAISSVLLGRGDSHLHESAARLKELDYSGWIVNENYYDVPPLVNENDDRVELMKRDLNPLRTEFS